MIEYVTINGIKITPEEFMKMFKEAGEGTFVAPIQGIFMNKQTMEEFKAWGKDEPKQEHL